VIFLRRLVDGGANRSYGIQVAKLAGLPSAVVKRARAILAELESGDGHGASPGRPGRMATHDPQLDLALVTPPSEEPTAERSVLDELAGLDPDRTTPIDALLAVQRWRARLREGR
jgi:DNA mismatch repair protein MutS